MKIELKEEQPILPPVQEDKLYLESRMNNWDPKYVPCRRSLRLERLWAEYKEDHYMFLKVGND